MTFFSSIECDEPKYLSMASRSASSEATTGSTRYPVINVMSSIAKTLDGSVIATVRVAPVFDTGMN